MSDYDVIMNTVRDHTRPLTRGALATRIWEARGGERADWARRIAVLVEGGALESRRWPGATRRVNTDRVFVGTRTVEYAVGRVAARLSAEARTRAQARASTGDEGVPGRGSQTPTASGRVGRVQTWR
jgi:hypothetical protein